MTEHRPPAPTLRDLVAAKVGKGKAITYQAFADAAIDPETGYRASTQIAQSIVKGDPIKPLPRVLGAIAAGINELPERVRRAAAREYTGLDLEYDPRYDYPAESGIDDMTWDPLPDGHSAAIVVTASVTPGYEDEPVSPQVEEAIRKHTLRMEMEAAARTREK